MQFCNTLTNFKTSHLKQSANITKYRTLADPSRTPKSRSIPTLLQYMCLPSPHNPAGPLALISKGGAQSGRVQPLRSRSIKLFVTVQLLFTSQHKGQHGRRVDALVVYVKFPAEPVGLDYDLVTIAQYTSRDCTRFASSAMSSLASASSSPCFSSKTCDYRRA